MQKLPVSVLREAHADINDESFSDVSGQTAPAAFSLLSLHNASQLWSNSAPELVTIEQLNPTSSNPTSFCEVLYCACCCSAITVLLHVCVWMCELS